MGAKRIVTIAAAAGLGLLSTGAAAASEATGSSSGATSEAQAAKDGKKDPSKRVCRSLVPTGSRLSTRICRTQAEWDEEADRIRNEMQRQQVEHSTRQDTRVE